MTDMMRAKSLAVSITIFYFLAALGHTSTCSVPDKNGALCVACITARTVSCDTLSFSTMSAELCRKMMSSMPNRKKCSHSATRVVSGGMPDTMTCPGSKDSCTAAATRCFSWAKSASGGQKKPTHTPWQRKLLGSPAPPVTGSCKHT